MKASDFANDVAERELLGGLLAFNDSYVEVHDILEPLHFYNVEYGALYRVISENWLQGAPLDTQTLCEKAKVNPIVVADCLETAIFGAQKRTALAIVELAVKRKAFLDCQGLLHDMKTLPTDEFCGRLAQIALNVSTNHTAKKIYHSRELCKNVLDVQEDRRNAPGYIRGVRTGYPPLDHTLRGLRPKRLTLLVAATGFGKSTLALNIFYNIVTSGEPALFISTENDVEENVDRLCGIVTGIDVKEVESGKHYRQVSEKFIDVFKDRTMFISDNSPRTVNEIVGTITRHVLQHRVKVVFVDYIGEISGELIKGETEEAKLARYTQTLLECSRNLGCHIVILAQLNRNGNRNGRPGKTELQGCFKMAQKAHSLLLFWQDEDRHDILTVDKNRQGPPNVDMLMHFNRNTQKIEGRHFWSAGEKKEIAFAG